MLILCWVRRRVVDYFEGRTRGSSHLAIDLDDAQMPPSRPQPKKQRTESLTELFRLDAPVNPGLKVAQFRQLFRRCVCGLVTTRRAFSSHFCIKQVGQLERRQGRIVEHVDLTQELDDTHSDASTVTDVED